MKNNSIPSEGRKSTPAETGNSRSLKQESPAAKQESFKSAFEMPKIDPKLIPALLAGGAGALAGGALTSMSPERQGESRMHRRWRILRNALLLGGAGAGGTALLQKGVQNAITEPLPANDVNPTKKMIHDVTGSKWGIGGGAVAGGLWQGHARSKLENQYGRNLLGSELINDLNPGNQPRIGLRTWLDQTNRKNLNLLSPQMPTQLSDVDKGHFRDAGINVLKQENKMKLVGHPKPHSPWRVLGEDAKIMGRRLTGHGTEGLGMGLTKRVGRVGAGVALPLLISYLTRPDTPQ